MATTRIIPMHINKGKSISQCLKARIDYAKYYPSYQICKEHSLSVIENPQAKSVSYDKWLGEKAQISLRDTIREAQGIYTKSGAKLPTLQELSDKYQRLLEQKRESAVLESVKSEVSDLWHIKTNTDTIADDEPPDRKHARQEKQNTR